MSNSKYLTTIYKDSNFNNNYCEIYLDSLDEEFYINYYSNEGKFIEEVRYPNISYTDVTSIAKDRLSKGIS